MSWLYIPSQSVPVSAVLTSPSSSPRPAPSLPFLTLRGKVTQPASLRRAWRTKPYLSRLCGLTSKPSAMQNSALTFAREQRDRESTSSSAASPASLTQSPASNSGPTIRETFGRTPCEFLRRLSRGFSSSKTSLECSATCPEGRLLICNGLGTSCLDRSCLKPRTSELPSAGKDCSSWPTAKVGCHGEPVAGERHETILSITERWPTMTATASHGNEYQNQKDGSTLPTLAGAAQQWQTPQTPAGGGKVRGGDRGAEMLLPMQAEQLTLWVTPMVPNGGRNGARTEEGREGKESGIEHQVQTWATPQATDDQRDRCSTEFMMKTRQRAACSNELAHQVRLDFHTGPQAPPIEENGSESSKQGPTSRPRLNPRFVEWLMGFPEGWVTLKPLALTSFERWAMQSSLCVARLRS